MISRGSWVAIGGGASLAVTCESLPVLTFAWHGALLCSVQRHADGMQLP